MNKPAASTKVSLGSFNFVKGIAISAIILGHIALEFDMAKLTWFYPLFIFCGIFKTAFIPLFFIISGYTYKKKPFAVTFKKTIRSLLIPYFVVMIAFTILHPAFTYIRTQNLASAVNWAISIFLAFLLGIPIPGKQLLGFTLSHCSIVWFLLAAFWGYLLLNLVLKQRHIILQTILVVSCAVLGYLLFSLDFTFFCLPHGLIAVTYFYVGYVLKKLKVIEHGLKKKWLYAAWVIISLLYACWGEFDLCYGKFAFFPMDYVGVIFLALLLMGIGLYVGRLDWPVFDDVYAMGAYSHWVLCLHSIEQKCLPCKLYTQWTANMPNLSFLFALLIKAVLISSGCMLIRKYSKRKYRKYKRKNEL